MKRNYIGAFVCAAALLGTFGPTSPANAQIGVGTWVRQAGPAKSGNMTMTVEACCNGGRRLTYRMSDTTLLMVVESPFDGKEVPVLVGGKPGGQTMAITQVDPRHTSTVVKMNGKPFGISKSALSADARTLMVENDFSSSGGSPAGKTTETWVRK